MKRIKDRVEAEAFIKVCNESRSMSEAAATLGIYYSSLRRLAIKLGCFNPNKSGKGILKTKAEGTDKYYLKDILNGKYPGYHTYKLKIRLLKEGLLKNICAECGLVGEWNGKKLEMELDHIDGIKSNHALKNLRMLCPNCHSQTDTYCSKNIVFKRNSKMAT